MLGLLELLINGVPKMPPRAEAAVMAKGVALIKFLVEEERRKQEARKAAATHDTSGSRFSIVGSAEHSSNTLYFDTKDELGRHSGVRWSCASYDFDCFDHRPKERVPPDLHARILSFPARLLTYVHQKCCGKGIVAYTRSGVSKQIYSRIVSHDDEVADKKTVMKFCIGLQLSMSEAELLMRSAGFAFSRTIPLDSAFVFAIENKIWNIADVNELLTRNGLPDLGLKF